MDLFSVEVYKVTKFYSSDSVLFENCVEMVSGEAVGVGDFFHGDVLILVNVCASGIVPLAFGNIGGAVLALTGDFVRIAEVAYGFGAHSGLLSELVEGVPFLGIGVIFSGECLVYLGFVVEVLAAYDAWLDSEAFCGGVQPADGDAVFFHYLFFGHPVGKDVFFFGGARALYRSACSLVEVFSGDSDRPVGEAFEWDAVALDDAVEGGA